MAQDEQVMRDIRGFGGQEILENGGIYFKSFIILFTMPEDGRFKNFFFRESKRFVTYLTCDLNYLQ